MPIVIDLTKQTSTYLSSLHPKWKAAKVKHATVLKDKKISLSKGLGAKLDKRVQLYKAIKAYKAGDPVIFVKGHLNNLKSNAKEILTVAKSYQTKIKGLGDPAEKELNAVLTTIITNAGNYDIHYVDTKLKKK